MAEINKPKLAYIDALRGIAASYVVLFHLRFVPIPPLPAPDFLIPIIGGGWTGVTLFFLVSAFTLSLSMDETWHLRPELRVSIEDVQRNN